jgi:hypothetical protein
MYLASLRLTEMAWMQLRHGSERSPTAGQNSSHETPQIPSGSGGRPETGRRLPTHKPQTEFAPAGPSLMPSPAFPELPQPSACGDFPFIA